MASPPLARVYADCCLLLQTIIEVGLAHVEWKAGSGKAPKVKSEHLSESRLSIVKLFVRQLMVPHDESCRGACGEA